MRTICFSQCEEGRCPTFNALQAFNAPRDTSDQKKPWGCAG